MDLPIVCGSGRFLRSNAACALALTLAMVAACADDAPNADLPQLHDIESAPQALQDAAKAVVRIQHPAGGSGTGSFISSDGLLLTNNHVLGTESCAREGCSISVSFEHQRGTLSLPPRQLFAVPQQASPGLDMAVLQVFLDDSQKKRLSTPYFLEFEPMSADALVGEHVTAVGHPLGRLKKWSSGVVIHADGEWFESTIFSLPGNSGSPILNDAGRIIGLLHRGAEGFDLLTETSSQVAAIGTASAALMPELGASLPASVISVEAPITREAALAHSDAFLAASAWYANIDGASVSLVSLLGDACDESLARDDYTSLEELQSGAAPCFAALDFIECRTDVGEGNETTPRECPEDEARKAWRLRLETLAHNERDFNGSLDLSAVSFSTEVLADTQLDAERTAREGLIAVLDDAKPVLDFSIASYLAAYGVDSYDGASTRDFIEHYARVPFYERYGWEIAISALWLYSEDLLDRKQAFKIAKELYHSDKLSIGSKLRIEEVLYNSDEL